jgi:acetolactate synthase-1/2/3 large subunit
LSVVADHPPLGGVRVADQIVRVLRDAGVNTLFGVPGGAIAAIYDALLDEPRIRVINSRHESSAVFAAAAHARATGSVGVVLTTSGPGVTNAITGIASSFCDGLPVLVISGEVPRKNYGRGALQEGSPYHLNLVAMLKHVTKWATEVTSPDSAVAAVRKGLATAASGRRGPVFVSIPLDLQGATTSVPRVSLNVDARFEVDRSMLHASVNALLTAQRPLILAGSGTRWSDGPAALLELAERFQVPVATTPKAKGVFPETHALSLGVYGLGGHPSAKQYLEAGIDILFAVGTSFGDLATDGWSDRLRPSKTFIQIDIDSAQIGRNYPADLGLVGSAGTLMSSVAALAPPARPVRASPGRQQHTEPALLIDGDKIKPQRALWELQQLMPASTAYACDIGDHTLWALHYLTIDQPDAFFLSSGLASMGSSLGTAIGLKLADPHRPVVVVCGDGTLSMNGLDVADAVQNDLNIVYLVLNDGRYGMVENGHRAIFGRTPEYPLHGSITGFARGVGARTVAVRQPGELLALGTRELIGHSSPLVIDVQFDTEERMPKMARLDSLKSAAAPQATVGPQWS